MESPKKNSCQTQMMLSLDIVVQCPLTFACIDPPDGVTEEDKRGDACDVGDEQ